MEMLIRTDPFRELDRLTQMFSGGGTGSRLQPSVMPIDAYRQGDRFVVHFDLPGVDPDAIDVTVEKNTLTVSADRRWESDDDTQVLVSERPQGSFSRQLMLGDGLDPDQVEASYDAGVLTVTVPVAEQAKPRRVSVGGGRAAQSIEANASDTVSSR
jgi:HSP20 family protein